jgi:hypothetical protein
VDYESNNEGCVVCEEPTTAVKSCLRCGQQQLFCSDCDGELCDYCQHMTSKDD